MEILTNYFLGVHDINSNEKEILSTYLDDNTNGYGKLYIWEPDNKYVYNGEIKDGKMNGSGIIRYIENNSNYKSYDGNFKDNKFNGFGKLTFQNDDVFVGNFKDNNKHGSGKLYNSSGIVMIDNIWNDNVIMGKVQHIEYHNNTKDIKLIGTLLNSVKVGNWIHIQPDFTISKIEFYKNYNDLSDMKEELESVLVTHNTGYMIQQKMLVSDDISDIDLIKYNNYYKEKLIYDPLKIDSICETVSKFAIPVNKTNEKMYVLCFYPSNIVHQIKLYNYEDCKIKMLNSHNKYTIYESNNKGQIYVEVNNNILLNYDGEINKNDQYEGQGTLYNDGVIYLSGLFEKNHIKQGVLFRIHDNNPYIYYEGTFSGNNIPNGKGIYYNHLNYKLYEGDINNNHKHGHGVSYFENGIIEWDGGWSNDEKHGRGTLYDSSGDLVCVCIHERGQLVDIL